MYIYMLKKKHEWCCTAFWMQNEKECAKKKEKKGERGMGMDGIIEVCDV